MPTRNFISFIKVGDRLFMERLVKTGEVFCRPYAYFRTIEAVDLRHDSNEGAGFIEQIRDLELMDPETKTIFGRADAAQLYFHHRENQGNIYCVYGIETPDLSDSTIKPFNLDIGGLNFGDSAVVIFQPGVFIERFKAAVKASGLAVECRPVVYYDHVVHKGALSPFHKSKRYEPQKEVRFWIPNQGNENLTFHLGDLSDIAKMIEKSDLLKLSYGPAD